MTDIGHGGTRNPTSSKIVVVTPTWNRRTLLPKLHESLLAQTDPNFVWVVVDDASEDGTAEWLAEAQSDSLAIQTLRNDENIGKCASLNRAFDQVEADFYLVVDSDDLLLPNAIQDVREEVTDNTADPRIGAIFFRYGGVDEVRLRSAKPYPDGIVQSRAGFDAVYGKFDGCIGYYRRVVQQFRYPEYPGETYVGPTVLQLRMHPKYQIRFTHVEIGVADYQVGGLTASGRRLRIANPLGMMEYAKLQSEQASSVRVRIKNAAMYRAYRSFLAKDSVGLVPSPTSRIVSRVVARVLGVILARMWRRRQSP